MNVSISELVLVLLIALLVIKPEQLPDAAFTVGRFFKSMRRLFNKMKGEMDRFMDAHERTDEQS